MKHCLKIITLFALALLLASPALAGKQFMPFNAKDNTLINGKKFIGLGGGQDPIKVASLRKNFHRLRPKLVHLSNKKKVEKEEITEPKNITSDKAEENTEELSKKTENSDNLAKISPTKKPSVKEWAKTLSSKKKNGKIRHLWPVDETVTSRISSPFGYRTHPVTGKHSFHAGLDIAAPKGTKVSASAIGEVTDIGTHKNLGKYVKVTHDDGTYSLYGHLSKITAKTGTQVAQGEKIGEVGSTGRSTGPHLDYSLRRGKKAIDPQKHLTRRSKQQIASNR